MHKWMVKRWDCK